jgi:hypothetical protein
VLVLGAILMLVSYLTRSKLDQTPADVALEAA